VVVTVLASLALGWRPGLIHLLAVAAGWSYNLGLKSRVVSPLPYLLAFAALPVIATTAAPRPHWPPGWAVAAAGLIGVAAHFANVLPDLPDDLLAGVRGLPQRLGSARSAAAAAVLTVAATALVLFGPGGRPLWLIAGALVVVIALVAGGLRAGVHGRGPESAFYATMFCAALDVGLIAVGGGLSG
jgi:4-hydroxybenzoate polyprenyltransferase